MPFLLVFVGAGLGGVLRYGLSLLVKADTFPLATLFINAAGSFLMGALAAWLVAHPNPSLRLFVGVGVLGGFTTFSAFSLEMLELVQRGAHETALLYLISSLVLTLGGVALGFALVKMLT